MRRRGLTSLLAALAAAGVTLAEQAPAPAPDTTLPIHRKIGGDFSLTQPAGPPARLADYRGRVVLLSFGFTHCPDVCPATLARLASVHDLLGEDAEEIQVLFVSFDPERDTPEHMARYLEFFDESFVGISGPVAELRELATRYRVVFERVEGEEAGDYTYAHTNRFYLIDRAGRVRKLYRPSADPAAIAEEVRHLLAEPVS